MKAPLAVAWSLLTMAAIAVGVASFYGSRAPRPPRLDPALALPDTEASLKKLQMRQQVDHPVTESMRGTAAELAAQPAPDFALPDPDGKTMLLQDLNRTKPVLLFFVERDCPCCIGAKYFVDKLVELYPEELEVVAIINANPAQAKAWVAEVKPHFRVLLDPMQKTIRAYRAEAGVYTTLVAPGGTIDKAYPGYSLEMLKDVSARVAALAKIEPRPFISTAAPKEMTSGCPFPPPGE